MTGKQSNVFLLLLRGVIWWCVSGVLELYLLQYWFLCNSSTICAAKNGALPSASVFSASVFILFAVASCKYPLWDHCGCSCTSRRRERLIIGVSANLLWAIVCSFADSTDSFFDLSCANRVLAQRCIIHLFVCLWQTQTSHTHKRKQWSRQSNRQRLET